MNHQLRIRPMLAEELPLAARYTLAEGWLGEDLASFVAFYQHDPGGCFFAERAGQVTGMVIATCYGQVGFIGELIVDPAARNQGIGAQLLDHAVAYLYSRNATTVYLDGVLKAVPLYERHGFRKLCRSLRFYGKLPGKTGTQVQPMLPEDLESVCALDRVAFGQIEGTFCAGAWNATCIVAKCSSKMAGCLASSRVRQAWVGQLLVRGWLQKAHRSQSAC
jgi:ribosomal protein S18 acetylase RimI-like enzyme